MPPRPRLTRVPTIAQVVPGAHVHIVLKQDQPTGRTVDGVVQTVLTRSNHPRGIKVRLGDGRVGRVQLMGDGKTAPATVQHQFADESLSAPVDQDAPREQVGLDAYIRPAKANRRGREQNKIRAADVDGKGSIGQAATPSAASLQSPTMTCPVCGAFEGDEAAVSHHVASHFDT